MKLGDPLPPFDRSIRWLDDRFASFSAGVPVLVHFWSSECALCHEGTRHIASWRSRFSPDRLTIVAIFQARPDASAASVASPDADAVRADARTTMSIEHPCAIDVGRKLERRFDNAFAPSYFVFDADHRLRHRQTGNAQLDAIGVLLERLAVKASPAAEA